MQRALRSEEMVMMPFWGLGKVTGVSHGFYHIRPLRLHHPIRIPESNLAEMGIRPILSEVEMSEIIFLQRIPQRAMRQGLSGGYNQWIELLRSGMPGVRPWILRQMCRCTGPLGPRASELRAIIRQNFREEIQVVFGCSRRQAAAYARKALG